MGVSKRKHEVIPPGAIDKEVLGGQTLWLKAQAPNDSDTSHILRPHIGLNSMQVKFRRERMGDHGLQGLPHEPQALVFMINCVAQHRILKGPACDLGKADTTNDYCWLDLKL